jgi:hypothetical protein
LVLTAAAVISNADALSESSDLKMLEESDLRPLQLVEVEEQLKMLQQDGGDVRLLHERLGAAVGSAPIDAGQEAAAVSKSGGSGSGQSEHPKATPAYAPAPKKEDKHIPKDQREMSKEKVKQNIDMTHPLPLSLAGQSGYDTKCVVKHDTVEVSGRGESACLFTAPIIKGQSFPVQITFDISFSPMVKGDAGRHGGIFYGARSNVATRAGHPTIDWVDRKVDHGYRVYGNRDVNKVKGMSPGPNPNRRWAILLQPDGRASFTAGPKTWVKDFHPGVQGSYFGFWCAAGNKIRVTNVRIKKVTAAKVAVKKKAAATGRILTSRNGYGKGVAVLFYSATGGSEGKVAPKSVYLKGSVQSPRDFRTRHFETGVAMSLLL